MKIVSKKIINEEKKYWDISIPKTHNYVLSNGCVVHNTGVGYSVQKHHIEKLPEIRKPKSGKTRRYLIGDSIEGWADSIKILFKSYFGVKSSIPVFDYSDIRPKGAELVTSGGKAPGPQPLKDCMHNIQSILDNKNDGEKLEPIEVHDIICHIADSVLAGGIRRAALISLFSADDNEMLSAKTGSWWEKNPQRGRANNSAVLLRHRITKEVFLDLWKRIELSNAGEPGIFFTNDKDWGTNPCAEIALRPYGFCNLTEINVSDLETQEEFNQRAKAASFIGTLQAAYVDFHYLRDVWKRTAEKDSLLGVSMTGIGSGSVLKLNMEEAAKVVVEENNRVSELLNIKPAARTTTVKPSGCRPHYSLVTTNDGIYTLDELFVDHNENEQWSDFKNENVKVIQDNTINKITKTFNNGKSKIYGIKLEGQILLESTENHPWFVSKNYDRKKYTDINDFIPTNELKEGDIIEIKLGVYDKEEELELNKINMFQYKMKHNTEIDINQPDKMDNDLAWLIGYLWGNGSFSEHKYRLRFIDQHLYNIKKVKRILKEKFNVIPNIIKLEDRDAYELYINSIQLYHWFASQGIHKYSNGGIDVIPLAIRRSSWKNIVSFIAGFSDADGSIVKKENNKRTVIISQSHKSRFARHLQDVALSVGIHFNHSYNKEGKNHQKNKDIILLSSTSFSLKRAIDVFEQNSEKSKHKHIELTFIHNENGSPNQILGKVKKIEYLREDETYDVEVENDHWFYGGAVKTHNTASLVLGTSSGIHAWHNDYYIRRIRVGKNEPIYTYLSIYHPELLEDEYFRPHDTAVISIPQHAPEGSIMRDESPLNMLERVKRVHSEWIKPGHNSGYNTHNVSATVSLKPEEWKKVGEWMWENRDNYSGLSVLPFSDHTYKQAPFEDCDKQTYDELYKYLKDIDLTKVVELKDNTNLSGEIACSGPTGCEIV